MVRQRLQGILLSVWGKDDMCFASAFLFFFHFDCKLLGVKNHLYRCAAPSTRGLTCLQADGEE